MSVTFFAPDAQDQTSDLEINVSNANAAFILDALGYAESVTEGELFGETSGEDFLGRVMVALGLAPADEGRPSPPDADHVTVVDCGRRPGYLQEKLDMLRELGDAAKGFGSMVVWG
jgi:hypothetical protein